MALIFFLQDEFLDSQEGFRNRNPGRRVPDIDGLHLQRVLFAFNRNAPLGIDFLHRQVDAVEPFRPLQKTEGGGHPDNDRFRRLNAERE